MIEFKNDKARETYKKIDERLKDAVYWCSKWCDSRKVPFVITRCIDEMIPGVSKTNIHADGRAVDVSVKGWDADTIDDFIHDSNKEFSDKIGAISVSDGKPRFCVYHCGVGYHLHLQTKKGI